MRNFTLLLLAGLLSLTARAQVTGLILDEGQKAVTGASIALHRTTDSSAIKYTVSDAQGKFGFGSVPSGNYFFRISHVGYADRKSAVFTVKDNQPVTIPPLLMSKAAADLTAAVVSSRKPVLEVKADRMILNVEGSVNSVGQDALELLRKSP